MTELAAGGSSAEQPTGYINGKGTHEHRLRRRVAGSHRASDRVPAPATDSSPTAQLGAWQLAQYRCALETAGHMQEIWRDGLSALARAGMAQWQEAGERAMAAGHTNMDVPISLGVLLAPAMSIAETARGAEHAYFDSAITLLFFLLIGRYLDQRARGVARSAAERLLALTAGAVTLVLPDGSVAPGYVTPDQLEQRLVAAEAALAKDGGK